MNDLSRNPSRMIEKPLFLVGSERSGTTLLRLMLDHHPQIAFHFEFEFAVRWIPENDGWPPLGEYYGHLELDRVFQHSNFEIDRSLGYPELVNSFLLQKREREKKPIVGATVHQHFDRLTRVWPDARFIHIVRDGRDVARSGLDLGWVGNVWHGAERWVEAEELWRGMAATVPAESRTEVKFEELVRDAPGTLKELCDFVGVPYSESMFDYAKTSTYALPDPKLVHTWRTRLTDHEVRLLEARIGEMLVERGYELSGLPRLEVSPRLARRLLLLSRWRRFRFRMRRYGWRLFWSEMIARRLGMTNWSRRLRLRMNAVEQAQVK